MTIEHTVSEEQFDILINNYNRWECELCKEKIWVEMNGADRDYKISKLKDHMRRHTYPYRDPLNEKMDDFWFFTGERVQTLNTGSI